MRPPSTAREWSSLVRVCCAVWLGAAFVLASACGTKSAPQPVPSPAPTSTRSVTPHEAPRPVAPPAAASPTASPVPTPAPLLGRVTRAELKAYAPWALLWEYPYVPDAAAVATIKACRKDYTALLIMGTWCPDSKREVPRFFATMDAAGLDDSVLTMVGVDRTKKDAEGLTEKWNITRVPTWVFFRDGKEIGRFVERTPADSTFEAEIARILGGGVALAPSR